VTGLSPKKVAAKSWLAHLDPSAILRFKDIFEIRKRPYGKESPQVLSLTNRGIMERDISSNEGQLAESYDNYQVVEPGDFVLNPMDLLSGWVARSPFEGVVSNAYFVFRLSRDALKDGQSPSFYEYVLQSYYKNGILEPFGKGVGRPENGGGRWTINAETLGTIAFPRIDSISQNSIVEFLDREIAQIETLAMKQQQLVSLLDERAETLLEKYLTGTPGATKKRLKHIASIKNGYSFDASQFDSQGLTPVVRQSDFFGDELTVFTDEKTPKSALIQNGEILVSLSGDFNCVMWSGGQAGLNQRCASIKSKHEGIDPDWLKFAVELGLRDITNENVSTTVSNMSSYELKNMKISVPSTERQRQIAVNLSSELNAIKELQLASGKLLSRLLDRRESLIFAAVIGQLDLGGI
jgi:type I restriction enzyme S subunit